jgi:hypothetical protein
LNELPSAAAIESKANVELQFFFRRPSVRLRRFPVQMRMGSSLINEDRQLTQIRNTNQSISQNINK